MEYKINTKEREKLRGLPYLQRLLYIEALRPYMDYATGIVGIKRGISYQSMAEEMYIDPHPGYRSGSPSRDQIRRAIQGLKKSGLIQSQNHPRKLIFKCLLATQDSFIQNKAAIKQPYQDTTKALENLNKLSDDYDGQTKKAAITELAKTTTPPVSGNNYIFLRQLFEIFWNKYPEKKSKQKAWEIFQAVNPSKELFERILQSLEQQKRYYISKISAGHWTANWKHPANWLQQQSWEDEIISEGDYRHETSQANHTRKQTSSELIWESCKSGLEEQENAEVINIAKYR